MLKSRVLFLMKSKDRIFGFVFSETSKFYIILLFRSELIRQVNATEPFFKITKSHTPPLLKIISSGWQIFLQTISAKFSKLFLERLFRKPSPSKRILLASILYSLCIVLGKDSRTSSCESYSNCYLI